MARLEEGRVLVQLRQHGLLGVEAPCAALEFEALLARNLAHAALRRQVAIQDLQVARGLDGGLYRTDDGLIVCQRPACLQVL